MRNLHEHAMTEVPNASTGGALAQYSGAICARSLAHAHVRSELEAAISDLFKATRIDSTQRTRKMNAVISAMHELAAKIDVASGELDEEELAEALSPAYALYSGSPFINRLQNWPRGYPGDFETIEVIMDGRPGISEDHPAYWLDWYALNTPIACQHRNKLSFQASQIAKDLDDNADILSVGCGGGRDLAMLAYTACRSASFCLIDIEQDALDLAESRLDWARSVSAHCGDAVRVMRKLNTQYDRIVFGGLFDYLSDRVIVLLLKMARTRLLKDGGRIIFTNLAQNNGFTVWLENLAAWHMTYRDIEDLKALAIEAGICEDELTVETDATGLSYLCTAEPK